MTGYVSLTFICAACRAVDMANPNLVMSIPVGDRPREPVCEACARKLLARFVAEGKSIPAVVQQPEYFERAYGEPFAEEGEVS